MHTPSGMYVYSRISLCIHTTDTSIRTENTAWRKIKLRGKVILQNIVCLYSVNTNTAVEASRSILTPQTHLISLELLACVTTALCLMHVVQFLQTPWHEGLTCPHILGPSPAVLLAHPRSSLLQKGCSTRSSWRLLALRRLRWGGEGATRAGCACWLNGFQPALAVADWFTQPGEGLSNILSLSTAEWVTKPGCAVQGCWAGVGGTVTANFSSLEINQNCYLLSNKPQHLTKGTRQCCCKQHRHERKQTASSAGPYHQNRIPFNSWYCLDLVHSHFCF